MVGSIVLKHALCYSLSLAVFGVGMILPASAGAVDLASHKAIYDIRLTSAKSGGQVVDVRGKMLYTLHETCDGYISDHKFNLGYEYSGTPAVQVDTKFTSFESKDGKQLNFSSNRISNGEMDQELRGTAKIPATGVIAGKLKSEAVYSIPDTLRYDLTAATLFPAAHTINLIDAAQKGQKFYRAAVFDGSDDQGPVEINAVIGKKVSIRPDGVIDKKLMSKNGWSMRLAVFPSQGDEQEISDYEMTMELLDNGVVRSMTVDYHDFSVSQKLVAIEPLAEEKCGEN